MGKFKNINDLKADEDVVTEGVELAFGKKRFIIITRSGVTNRKYKATMARVFKPHQLTNGTVSLENEEATELLKQVYAEAVVLGWRGFADDKGNNIPYSKDNCIELFTEAPEIFQTVQDESAKFSNFARRAVTESGKE